MRKITQDGVCNLRKARYIRATRKLWLLAEKINDAKTKVAYLGSIKARASLRLDEDKYRLKIIVMLGDLSDAIHVRYKDIIQNDGNSIDARVPTSTQHNVIRRK